MTRSNGVIKSIFNVMCSNIITLFSSIVNGLVLPYILGATNYGHYRIFILYSTYTALLHCGFVDGILLKYGGIPYNKLNKTKFSIFTKSFIIFQFVISLIFVIVSLFILNHFYSILFLFLGLYTFVFNIWTYYMFISQITMKFKLLSLINIVQSLLSILSTLFICMIYKIGLVKNISYVPFIYIIIITYFIVLIWYMYIYKGITFNEYYNIRKGIYYIYNLCKLGIYLTISYQVSNLIMIIDNQIISMFFKANTYGKYSFSYSMTNTAITVLSAVATVLLPHLKRDTFHHMIKVYHKMISSIMLVVYLGLLAYFPLCVLVSIILPEYIQSLSYLKIFLPELGITCSVTMITFNYYNALGKSKFYFYMSLVILIISVIIDSAMYMLFHDPILVAFGSFISIFIWYLASEYFLVKWYHVQWMKNLIYMMIMIGSFFVASMVPNLVIGFGAYFIAYVIVSWIMFKKIIEKNVSIVMKKI